MFKGKSVSLSKFLNSKNLLPCLLCLNEEQINICRFLYHLIEVFILSSKYLD